MEAASPSSRGYSRAVDMHLGSSFDDPSMAASQDKVKGKKCKKGAI